MGKVIMSGVSKGMEVPSAWSENFADNTWAQIITACETDTVPATWEVGDQKSMTINGTSYMIDIIGKNHDTYTDGGTAPLTFQLHDCYATTRAMNGSNTNVGGWRGCNMRTNHIPDILALMPSEVQAGVKEVNKPTSAGNTSATIDTAVDKLFLLSEIEVFGSISQSVSGEGSQYAYYAAGNSKSKSIVGSSGGTSQWLRSPSLGNSSVFVNVSPGGTTDYSSASYPYGIAPAFCF
jgi:hypothetical protein